mmetsp:Transcript_6880/g.10151  ORF Transcript_6880/g.10151 Transcript_6880/m.10151 type:complete len:358 (+) Transcript_6880:165-1238(+)
MIIVKVVIAAGKYAGSVQLSNTDIVVDPRCIMTTFSRMENTEFNFKIVGTTLVVTKKLTTIGSYQKRYARDYTFRIYNPKTEEVPNFTSTKYTYFGLEGELAPIETVQCFIHSSVQSIRDEAFAKCKRMKKCVMGDNVKRIERKAFLSCTSLQFVRLSRTLQHIGPSAFSNCYSMDALFIPSSVHTIGNYAFWMCYNLRILPMPNLIRSMGDRLFNGCEAIFEASEVEYAFDENDEFVAQNSMGVNNWLKHRLDDKSLHKLCQSAHVEAHMILKYMVTNSKGFACTMDEFDMMPFHILARNPHATSDTIIACLYANPNAAFHLDDRGMNGIDYLAGRENAEAFLAVIQALCLHRTSA